MIDEANYSNHNKVLHTNTFFLHLYLKKLLKKKHGDEENN
jgi:hypothetical protein